MPLTEQPETLAASLGGLNRHAPVSCLADTPLRAALQTMKDRRVGSMLVTDAENRPVGIFTLPDLRDRVVLSGFDIDQPIAGVMTPNPLSLSAGAPAIEAAIAMAQHAIRHVILVEDGRAVGVVSERDLFALQQASMSSIAMTLRQAEDLETLKQAAAQIRRLARGLLDQEASPEQVTRLISELNDQLSRRIVDQAMAGVDLQGVRWCWIALGSEGRLEQTLLTDQDNGLIFTVPEGQTADQVRARLLPAAQQANEWLAECGFPLCKGEIMASNPKWCMSREEWQAMFGGWLVHNDNMVLMHATIFFDFRALAGEADLAGTLREWLNGRMRVERQFLKLMVQNALANTPPLGRFRDFSLSEGGEYPHTLDLKINGITLFVDSARIMALANGVSETSTAMRLRKVVEAWKLDEDEVRNWIDAFHGLQRLRLLLHREQLARGEPMHNHLNPDELGKLDRDQLKAALKQARQLQGRLETLFKF